LSGLNEGQESADLLRLMPDEQGLERGILLFCCVLSANLRDFN
jgi:hypothetical protein